MIKTIRIAMRLILLAILLLVKYTVINAQGYHISIKIKGAKDTLYQVGHYWGGEKVNIANVAMLDGTIEWEGTEDLATGMYFVAKPGFLFDFLVTRQKLSLSLNADHPYESLRADNSVENQVYSELIQRLTKFKSKENELIESYYQNRVDSLTYINKSLDINHQLQAWLVQTATEYQELFVSKIIQLVTGIDIPSFDNHSDMEKRLLKQRNYYIDNYWDGIDLADSELLRNYWLYLRVDKYLTQNTLDDPEITIRKVDQILERSALNKDTFKYWANLLMRGYHHSTAPGMEKIYLHILEKYFLSGQAYWMPERTLSILKEDVDYLSSNLVGKKAPKLIVNDFQVNRSVEPIKSLRSDYAVLFFYDPTCGKCQKTATELAQQQDLLTNLDVDIMSIGIGSDGSNYTKFIEEYLPKGTSFSEPFPYQEAFRKNYDIRTTPKLYLIDRKRTIIGRNLKVNQLVDYVQYANNFAN